MEKRLNKKLELWITGFKDNIREKASQIGISKNDQTNQLIQYIYDYDRLTFGKEDFQKRKRVKNVVPFFDTTTPLSNALLLSSALLKATTVSHFFFNDGSFASNP